jgi:hypothetical protein
MEEKMKMFKYNFNQLFVLPIVFLIFILCNTNIQAQLVGTGQIVLTGSGIYEQNFDSLASSGTSSTLPYGWYFIETGTIANSTYTANNGSSNTGDTYSYGSSGSTERAFGTLLSGSLTSTIGAKFYNNTGNTITQLPITYTGEQWRLGATGRTDSIYFQFSTDATSLNNGNWTSVYELNFRSPITTGTTGPLDGNSPSNRTTITYTITGLNIPNGSTFWIRWVDANATNADDGLAIDEFSINESALPVQLFCFLVNTENNKVFLTWSTATEVQNYGWEIERSKVDKSINKASSWQSIGFVKGAGNSNSPKEYSFVDNSALYGEYAYRLKQIDIDGSTSYSDELRVFVGKKPEVYDVKTFPNPFNPETKIRFELPEAGNVKLSVYDLTGRFITTLVDEYLDEGIYEREFNGSNLSSGIYFTILQSKDVRIVRKMQLIK